MNRGQRILSTVSGSAMGCLAWGPITMMYTSDMFGSRYLAYATDHRVQATAQPKIAQELGFDHVSVISDPCCEVAGCGSDIVYFDIFVIQIDGTECSTTAGPQRCHLQPSAATPRFTWNPDLPLETDPRGAWLEVPDLEPPVSAFRRQWELFLRHVVLGEPFAWDLRDSARGVELAELALVSSVERRWIEIPGLPACI